MCGLVGIARFGCGPLPVEPDHLVPRMARAVAHRGPDETVLESFGAVTLGFARLSLVDPAGGGQPLVTDDGSLVLIANGEIYNHKELAATLSAGTRLRTGSDCEVLLHLYRRDGLAFLDHVRGMFALVLWDRGRNQLIFARDRFGIKPLYFHRDGERVVFASEIKALFEDPRTPRVLDWERALSDQLLSCMPCFDTTPVHAWFRDIELVPAATMTRFDVTTGARHDHRYWEFPTFDGTGDGSENELVRRYGETLASSVADCGMADVEVGLFLSGGIDSAAVALFAACPPRTFTALNASTFINQDAEYGHRVARYLGLENHQVLFDARQVPTAEEWKNHLWLVEAPIAGPESYYKYEMYRYVRQHAPEIKAMLLGVGSDEFNGGYSSAVAAGGDWKDFIANIDRMSLRDDQNRRPDLGMWWEHPGAPLLRTEALREVAGGARADPYSRYHRWKYRDVQQYNCWHEDRSAAGNGIEARVPFLDHRLVELTAAVPVALRPKLLWDKRILRRAVRGLLPQEIVTRTKMPFFYGEGVRYTYRTFARMLAQDGAILLEEALSAPAGKHFLDADHARAALAQLEADPGAGNLEFLLDVVNLGLLEQMAATLPAPPVEQATAPVAASITVLDWPAQRHDVGDRVLRRPGLAMETVLVLADTTLLLHSAGDPGACYLAIDGTIEFVLDDPEWLGFLLQLDGQRSVAEALAAASVSYESVAALVTESIDQGLLVVVPGARAARAS